MIGHYLLALDEEAEHDVMTGKMNPGSYHFQDGSRCLVGWAADFRPGDDEDADNVFGRRRRFEKNTQYRYGPSTCESIELRFDGLCDRFGVERIANAIRSRILTNQLRRQLQGQAVAV